MPIKTKGLALAKEVEIEQNMTSFIVMSMQSTVIKIAIVPKKICKNQHIDACPIP